MLFGIPWWGLVPIIAIISSFVIHYRKLELQHEEKMLLNSQEVHELRKIVHNLKSRIEHLETIVTEEEDPKKNGPIGDIEIKDDYYDEEAPKASKRTKN